MASDNHPPAIILSSMSDKIKVAVIGTGGIANAHMTGYGEAGDRVEVTAAMDVDAERVKDFAQRHKIPGVYTNLAELLEKERPALVSICTPPGTHYDLSVQCLEGGAWVLCEKPLCASLEQLDGLAAAEERTGRYCASIYQWRFGSAGQHLHRLVEQGALGRPLVGICNTLWHRGTDYYAVPWRGKFATEIGGPTLGHGIHAMDFFLWQMGPWKEVRAMIGTLDRDIETEDISMALVKFESGAMGSIINTVLCPRQESYIRWDFQKATVEVKGLYGYKNENWSYTPLPALKDEPEARLWEQLQTDLPSSHGAQIAHLLGAMKEQRRPAASGAEARQTLEFITCLYKSALTGRPVERGSIRKDEPFYRHVAGPLAVK